MALSKKPKTNKSESDEEFKRLLDDFIKDFDAEEVKRRGNRGLHPLLRCERLHERATGGRDDSFHRSRGRQIHTHRH